MHSNQQNPNIEAEEKPSKSALKRRYTELQVLGEKLIELTAEQLDSLPLEPELLKAIVDASHIKSNQALRRQRQLIGKLMRHADADGIRRGFEAFGVQERIDKRVFKDAEKWRDRITSEGSAAVLAFMELTDGKGEELQSLYQQYDAELSDKNRKVLYRKLFKVIHTQLGLALQDAAGRL